jgi:hypothetical protein
MPRLRCTGFGSIAVADCAQLAASHDLPDIGQAAFDGRLAGIHDIIAAAGALLDILKRNPTFLRRRLADVRICACPCVRASARDQASGLPCSAHVPRPRPAAEASSFTSLRRATRPPDPATGAARERRTPPMLPAAGVGWAL